jgi:hypothetical protein
MEQIALAAIDVGDVAVATEFIGRCLEPCVKVSALLHIHLLCRQAAGQISKE